MIERSGQYCFVCLLSNVTRSLILVSFERVSLVEYACQICHSNVTKLTINRRTYRIKIVAAFQGMHVLPAKHSYAWLPRKCDYRTDRQMPDKVIPMCRYALQAKQKQYTPDYSFQQGIKIISSTCMQTYLSGSRIYKASHGRSWQRSGWAYYHPHYTDQTRLRAPTCRLELRSVRVEQRSVTRGCDEYPEHSRRLLLPELL